MKATELNGLFALVLLWMFLMTACNHKPDDSASSSAPSTMHPDTLSSMLDEAHIALNKNEEKLINQYIKRHELKLVKTNTGLRYVVYKPGSGSFAKPQDVVVIKYQIQLINGVEVANSENDGLLEVFIEKSDAISGLHEVLQVMNVGAKARAIIPSYLAYGFTGDQDRIPKGATLVYDIEVMEIHKL
jgi:FKBP-type peptidyl-prolyl cis-trans isomerase